MVARGAPHTSSVGLPCASRSHLEVPAHWRCAAGRTELQPTEYTASGDGTDSASVAYPFKSVICGRHNLHGRVIILGVQVDTDGDLFCFEQLLICEQIRAQPKGSYGTQRRHRPTLLARTKRPPSLTVFG